MTCKGCKYRRPVSGVEHGTGACHYCVDTGEPRGCSARECYARKIHYAPKRKCGTGRKDWGSHGPDLRRVRVAAAPEKQSAPSGPA